MHEGQDVSDRADELGLRERVRGTAGRSQQPHELVLAWHAPPETAREVSRLALELGLSAYLNSIEALKSELQKVVVALHPDKTGGEFSSEENKARFMKARHVIELLNSGVLGAAPGTTPLPGALHAIGDASSGRRLDAARLYQRGAMADARERIARYFSAPKFGTAAAAAVTLALALLAGEFERNAVLGPWFADPLFVGFLLAMGCISAVGFLGAWICQRAAEARAEHLMSEAALGEVFEQARRCAVRYGRTGSLSAFDIRHGVEILLHGQMYYLESRRTWSFSRGLDLAVLENISTIQTQRLLERKVIRMVNTPSIEILYEVSPLMQA